MYNNRDSLSPSIVAAKTRVSLSVKKDLKVLQAAKNKSVHSNVLLM